MSICPLLVQTYSAAMAVTQARAHMKLNPELYGPLVLICFSRFSVLFSVWDLRSGSEVHSVPTTNAVTSLELSRDSTILMATHDRVVSLFDART